MMPTIFYWETFFIKYNFLDFHRYCFTQSIILLTCNILHNNKIDNSIFIVEFYTNWLHKLSSKHQYVYHWNNETLYRRSNLAPRYIRLAFFELNIAETAVILVASLKACSSLNIFPTCYFLMSWYLNISDNFMNVLFQSRFSSYVIFFSAAAYRLTFGGDRFRRRQ